MFYSNLFELEYKKTFPFVKISKNNILSIFLISLIIGILAFIMETFVDYFSSGLLFDRGFLIGPFIPLYAIVVFIFLCYVKTPMYCFNNLIKYFVIISISISLIEFIVGNVCEKLIGVELWKYDKSLPLSSKYVSLYVSIIWGIIGDFILFLIVPLFKKICDMITYKSKKIIMIFFIVYFILDVSLSIYLVIKNGKYNELYGPFVSNNELTLYLLSITLYYLISSSIFILLNSFKINNKNYLYVLYFLSVFIPYFSFFNYFIKFNQKTLMFLNVLGYLICVTYFILLLLIIINYLIKNSIKTKKSR